MSSSRRSPPVPSSVSESMLPRECGVVVDLQNSFGFLRSPTVSLNPNKKEEDVFFHFDELKPKERANLRVGDEFSYSIKIKGSQQQQQRAAVNMQRIPANDMFLCCSNKDKLATRFGQITSLSEETPGVGVLEWTSGNRKTERVEFLIKDLSQQPASVGAYCSFKLCIHPLHRSFVAVGPITLFAPATPHLGLVIHPTRLRLESSGEEVDFMTNLADLQIGDRVCYHYSTSGTPVAIATKLCIPKGEEVAVQGRTTGENSERSILLSWLGLDKGAGGEANAKEAMEEGVEATRCFATVVTVKEGQFSFAKMGEREEVYLNWADLCASPAGETVPVKLQVGDIVSFQLCEQQQPQQQQRQKRETNLRGMRIFNQSQFGVAKTGKKRDATSRICFKANNTGRVSLKGTRATAAAIDESFSPVLDNEEDVAIWQALLASNSSSHNAKKKHAALHGILPIEVDAGKRSFEDGEEISFDIFAVRKATQIQCVAVVPKPELRIVAGSSAEGGMGNVGIVTRVPESSPGAGGGGGMIFSTTLIKTIPFSATEHALQVGDWVKYTLVEGRNQNLQAVDLLPISATPKVDEYQALGLIPLRTNTLEPIRVRGICTRHTDFNLSLDASSNLELLARASSRPHTYQLGHILVGKSFVFQEKLDEDAGGRDVQDWRKLGEIQRNVRATFASQNTPHVFQVQHQSEVAEVQKEAKRLSLFSVFREGGGKFEVACGPNKQVLEAWLHRLNGQVTLPTVGRPARVVDCQFLGERALVLELELLEDGTRLCLLDSPTLQFTREQNLPTSAATFAAKLREWATFAKARVPPGGTAVLGDDSTFTIPLPREQESADALHASLLEECLHFVQEGETITVSCSRGGGGGRDRVIPSLAQYEFIASKDEFPIEGEEVDFIPCFSAITGKLRALDVRILTRALARTEGVVEEVRSDGSGGGCIRPNNLPSVTFKAGDVSSKRLALGDVVDFDLCLKPERVSRVRFLRHGPPPPSRAAAIPLTVPSSISNAPSRFTAGSATPNREDKKIAMPSNYLTAPGPDEDNAVGFTAEKWRFKRRMDELRADAAEFFPKGFVMTPSSSSLAQ